MHFETPLFGFGFEKRQRAVVDSHFSSPPILLVCDSDQTLRPESPVGQSLRILAAILD